MTSFDSREYISLGEAPGENEIKPPADHWTGKSEVITAKAAGIISYTDADYALNRIVLQMRRLALTLDQSRIDAARRAITEHGYPTLTLDAAKRLLAQFREAFPEMPDYVASEAADRLQPQIPRQLTKCGLYAAEVVDAKLRGSVVAVTLCLLDADAENAELVAVFPINSVKHTILTGVLHADGHSDVQTYSDLIGKVIHVAVALDRCESAPIRFIMKTFEPKKRYGEWKAAGRHRWDPPAITKGQYVSLDANGRATAASDAPIGVASGAFAQTEVSLWGDLRLNQRGAPKMIEKSPHQSIWHVYRIGRRQVERMDETRGPRAKALESMRGLMQLHILNGNEIERRLNESIPHFHIVDKSGIAIFFIMVDQESELMLYEEVGAPCSEYISSSEVRRHRQLSSEELCKPPFIQSVAADSHHLSLEKLLSDQQIPAWKVDPSRVHNETHDSMIMHIKKTDNGEVDPTELKKIRELFEGVALDPMQAAVIPAAYKVEMIEMIPTVDIRELAKHEVVRSTDLVKAAARGLACGAATIGSWHYLPVTTESAFTGEALAKIGEPVGERSVFRAARMFTGSYRRLDASELLQAGCDGFAIRDPWIWWYGLTVPAPGMSLEALYDLNVKNSSRPALRYLKTITKNFLRELRLRSKTGDDLFVAMRDFKDARTGAVMFPGITAVYVATWEATWHQNAKHQHDWLHRIQAAEGAKVEADQEDRFLRILGEGPTQTKIMWLDGTDPNWKHRLRLFEIGKEPNDPRSTIPGAMNPVVTIDREAQVDDMYGLEFEVL